jgi:hypothetical protein
LEKTIIGKVGSNSILSSIYSSDDEDYNKIGVNLISKSELEPDIYTWSWSNTEDALFYLRQSDALLLFAKFNISGILLEDEELIIPEDIADYNYSITISLTFEDDSTTDLTFNMDDILGNPYQVSEDK